MQSARALASQSTILSSRISEDVAQVIDLIAPQCKTSLDQAALPLQLLGAMSGGIVQDWCALFPATPAGRINLPPDSMFADSMFAAFSDSSAAAKAR